MATLREDSRKEWSSGSTVEEIQVGCLQRIANATEAMSENYVYMQKDRDMYKRWYEQEQAAKEKLQRSNNALRGHINRMKKKNHHP